MKYKYSIEELYETYSKQYDKSERAQEKLGLEPKYEKASFSDFRADFYGESTYYKDMGAKYSQKQVAEAMGRDDVSYASKSQAKVRSEAIAKFKLETGKITQEEYETEARSIFRGLRTGRDIQSAEDFWNAIKKERNALKQSGKDSKEINLIISQEFFGSD